MPQVVRYHLLSRSARITIAGVAGLAACALAAPAGAATAHARAHSRADVRADVRAHAAAAVPQASPLVIVVTSLKNSGDGSLRAAIRRVNGRRWGRSSVIDFAVHGTITLARKLPAISRPVTIDGRSAPGYKAGGPPVLEINFNDHRGLLFSRGSGHSWLLGTALDNASDSGVSLNVPSITLNHNYIGLDLRGAAFGNRDDGVYVSRASWRDQIGLNRSGASGVVGNVISGNHRNGILLWGSRQSRIVANRIGTDPSGSRAIANHGNGVVLTGKSAANEIGGTRFTDTATGQVNNPTGSKGTVTPVFVVPPLGNLISGNRQDGILINAGSRRNVLNGNFIGTTADGDAAIGNGGNGVWIDGAGGNSLIGCKFVNNPFVYYNVLSGNGGNGLRVTNSGNVTVQGNFFGIGADNTAVVANRLDGIRVDGSSADTQVGGVIPLGNVSAGNGKNGIEVTGTAHGFVTFNTFGGLLAFKGAAPNGNDGLLITSTGGDNLARTNVFSGNSRNGIELAGSATGVTIDPDIVGLNTKGNAVLPNGGDGVLIDQDAHGNTVGGSLRSVIPQDTFSGNRGYGLAIVGSAHGNRVFTSFIGTEILGVKALGNHAGGVLVGGGAYRNVIGGISTFPANLISGNTGNGVTLRMGTRRNAVIGNYIGLGRLGFPLPNSGLPVANYGQGNVVRGNRTQP